MHFASANILDTVYGIDPEELDQPLLQIAQRALDGMNEAGTTGVFSLLEQFPWLRYWPKFAPGGGFKKKLSVWKKDIQQMNDLPFATAVNYLRGGSASDHSLLAKWLNTTVSGENHHRQDLKPEDLIKDAAGNAFVAGVETTTSSLQFFFLEMMLYPEVQAKAHDELDRIIGRNRLPMPSDVEQLAYLKAIYKELLRWHPVVPLGIAHRAVIDDEYRGLFIPKGSLLIANSWTMLRDESTYGVRCDEFNPERFLGENKKDPTEVFGFGRRICPGRYFAEHSLFLTLASILHVYRLDKPVSMQDRSNLRQYRISSTLTVHPQPFDCSLVARFPEALRLVDGN